MTSIFELGLAQLVFWWIAGGAAATFLWVLWGGQHRDIVFDRQLAWWMWHWFTGGPLVTYRPFDDGERGPLPRAALRVVAGLARTTLAGLAVVAVYLRSGATDGTAARTLATVAVAGTAGFAALTVALVHVAARVVHFLQWERPLFRAIYRPAGWDKFELAKVRAVVVVPRMRFEGGDGVIVRLAPGFDWDDTHVKNINRLVQAKLDPAGEITPTPVPAGRHSYLQYRPTEPMPGPFTVHDDTEFQDLIATATGGIAYLGYSRGRQPVKVDLDGISPHILVSAPTGAGKTTITRTLAAQYMARGARLVVIDAKRMSHRWAREIPGVRYVCDLPDIHSALCQLAAIGDRRNRAWDPVTLDDDDLDLPRVIILFEEMNATMGRLVEWWAATREPGDPRISPAKRALGDILFMGRQVRINVFSVAQYATANTMGGTEHRENFTLRILSKPSTQAWKALAGNHAYQATGDVPGRVYVCTDTTVTYAQVAMFKERPTRDWIRGLPAPPPLALEADVANVADFATSSDQGRRVLDVAESPSDAVRLVTLAEASTDGTKATPGLGLIDATYHVLRAASTREAQFPAPVDRKGNAWRYPLDGLVVWGRSRQRSVIGRGSETPGGGRNEVDEVDRMEPTGRA